MRLLNNVADVEEKVRAALAELPPGPEDQAVTKHMLQLQRESELKIADLLLMLMRSVAVSMNPYDRIAAARWEIVAIKEADRCKSVLKRKKHERRTPRT
jgi:hypothetical protein